MKSSMKTRRLVAAAMFSALAFVTTFLCGYFPKVSGFLSLDFKDAIIVICALVFGPLTALPIVVLVAVLEMYTISTTEWYGLIMNILSSGTFVLVTGFIYKYKRSFYGAIFGLLAGVFAVSAVMMIANLFITPLYLTYMMGFPTTTEDIVAMLPTVLLPFNFIKATLNGALVLLIYKPVSTALKQSGFVEKKQLDNGAEKVFNLRTLVVGLIAAAIIAASLFVMFMVIK